MEGGDPVVVDISMASGTPSSSRWNPTKEQINMLESLYKQGIRTPSAEQIQEITSRLRAFGHIEGKNVFYWFQNHKARQRQKQKQESLAYFNRFLHSATPSHVLPPLNPPCPNVVCGPYYIPQSELGFYTQYPKVLLPASGIKRRSSIKNTENFEKYKTSNMQTTGKEDGFITSDQETLALFPLHPTGILQGQTGSFSPSSPETGAAEDCSSDQQQPFFDFFSGRSSCLSD